MNCCVPKGYGQVFDEREARRNARRYRKKGFEPMQRRMVEFLRGRVQDRTLLEVGGGVGALQLELLRAGAERTTNVELSPNYEPIARKLLDEAGLADRAERRLGDFTREPVPPADVVILDKVVCCYPDMPTLMQAAAEHTRAYLALVFPRQRWWMAAALWAVNLFMRLRRTDFRVYLHPPAAILAKAAELGLKPALEDHDLVWQLAVLERAS